jgi:hypothetical protein
MCDYSKSRTIPHKFRAIIPYQLNLALSHGLNLSYSNDSQGLDSLNPTQGFNLNQATLTKRGWGGLSKCSQGSQMCSEWNGINTHEWVKSWGINTPLSKISCCPYQCLTGQTGHSERSDRSVLKTSRWRFCLLRPVSPVPLWILQLTLSLSLAFLSRNLLWALLVLSKPTDVASLLIVRHTYTEVHKWNM